MMLCRSVVVCWYPAFACATEEGQCNLHLLKKKFVLYHIQPTIVSFMVTSTCVTGWGQINEDTTGVAYARIKDTRNAYRIWLETLKKRVFLEDFDVGERIILKWILRNWTDFSNFGWGPVAELSWTR